MCCLHISSTIVNIMMSLVLVLVLALVSGSLAAITAPWVDFRGHLAPVMGSLDGMQYRQMPKTLIEANGQNWISPPEENPDACNVDAMPYTILCPFSDPSLCLFYDKKGMIAGMEFGIVKSNAAPVYPYSKRAPFVSKRRFGYDCWITTVYLVEQSVINTGGRANLDNGTGSAVWMQNGRNNVFAIPRLEADLIKDPSWVKQVCSKGMGIMYQYKMSNASSCEDLFQIKPYYKVGELHGFSFQAFGLKTTIGNNNWMETITSGTMKGWTPSAPACLPTWMDKYGFVSMHVFFTVNPWYIPC